MNEMYAIRQESSGAGPRTDGNVASLRQVLEALGTALASNVPHDDLGTTFEQHVRQVLDLRAVRLREVRARYQARLVTPTRTADSIVLGVPTADPRVQAVLEASCQPDRPLQDPDYDVLVALAHVGGLVLEIGRGRTVATSTALGAGPLIGSTDVMQALRAQIERVAATDFTVLIEGESGTGKELVARQLHDLGDAGKGPSWQSTVPLLSRRCSRRSCSGSKSAPPQAYAAVEGSSSTPTVEPCSWMKSRICRCQRKRSFSASCRISPSNELEAMELGASTHASSPRPIDRLSDLVAKGLFRADLYYRLSGVEIHVPPLRSRCEDVPELVRYFLSRHRNRDLTLSAEAEQALRIYPWPGNVRELERLVERALALMESDRIELDDLPARIRGEFAEVLGPSIARDETMRAWACHYARLVFEKCGRNKRRACKRLNISYHTLEAYLRVAGRFGRGHGKRLPRWVRNDERAA